MVFVLDSNAWILLEMKVHAVHRKVMVMVVVVVRFARLIERQRRILTIPFHLFFAKINTTLKPGVISKLTLFVNWSLQDQARLHRIDILCC